MSRIFVITLFFRSAFLPLSLSATQGCGGDVCFRVTDTEGTWEQAPRLCAGISDTERYQFATILNADEQNVADNLIDTHNLLLPLWFGARHVWTDEWIDEDNNTLTDLPWGVNEPADNDKWNGAALTLQNGAWVLRNQNFMTLYYPICDTNGNIKVVTEEGMVGSWFDVKKTCSPGKVAIIDNVTLIDLGDQLSCIPPNVNGFWTAARRGRTTWFNGARISGFTNWASGHPSVGDGYLRIENPATGSEFVWRTTYNTTVTRRVLCKTSNVKNDTTELTSTEKKNAQTSTVDLTSLFSTGPTMRLDSTTDKPTTSVSSVTYETSLFTGVSSHASSMPETPTPDTTLGTNTHTTTGTRSLIEDTVSEHEGTSTRQPASPDVTGTQLSTDVKTTISSEVQTPSDAKTVSTSIISDDTTTDDKRTTGIILRTSNLEATEESTGTSPGKITENSSDKITTDVIGTQTTDNTEHTSLTALTQLSSFATSGPTSKAAITITVSVSATDIETSVPIHVSDGTPDTTEHNYKTSDSRTSEQVSITELEATPSATVTSDDTEPTGVSFSKVSGHTKWTHTSSYYEILRETSMDLTSPTEDVSSPSIGTKDTIGTINYESVSSEEITESSKTSTDALISQRTASWDSTGWVTRSYLRSRSTELGTITSGLPQTSVTKTAAPKITEGLTSESVTLASASSVSVTGSLTPDISEGSTSDPVTDTSGLPTSGVTGTITEGSSSTINSRTDTATTGNIQIDNTSDTTPYKGTETVISDYTTANHPTHTDPDSEITLLQTTTIAADEEDGTMAGFMIAVIASCSLLAVGLMVFLVIFLWRRHVKPHGPKLLDDDYRHSLSDESDGSNTDLRVNPVYDVTNEVQDDLTTTALPVAAAAAPATENIYARVNKVKTNPVFVPDTDDPLDTGGEAISDEDEDGPPLPPFYHTYPDMTEVLDGNFPNEPEPLEENASSVHSYRSDISDISIATEHGPPVPSYVPQFLRDPEIKMTVSEPDAKRSSFVTTVYLK